MRKSKFKIERWALALEPYNLKIKYIKGIENGSANYLSRNVNGEKEGHEEPGKIIIAIMNSSRLSNKKILDEIKRCNNEDTELIKVKKKSGRYGQ